MAAMPSVGRIKQFRWRESSRPRSSGVRALSASADDVWLWACHGPNGAGARQHGVRSRSFRRRAVRRHLRAAGGGSSAALTPAAPRRAAAERRRPSRSLPRTGVSRSSARASCHRPTAGDRRPTRYTAGARRSSSAVAADADVAGEPTRRRSRSRGAGQLDRSSSSCTRHACAAPSLDVRPASASRSPTTTRRSRVGGVPSNPAATTHKPGDRRRAISFADARVRPPRTRPGLDYAFVSIDGPRMSAARTVPLVGRTAPTCPRATRRSTCRSSARLPARRTRPDTPPTPDGRPRRARQLRARRSRFYRRRRQPRRRRSRSRSSTTPSSAARRTRP